MDRPFLERSAQVHSGDFIWRPGAEFQLQGQLIASIIDEPSGSADGDGEVLQAFYTPSPDWQYELSLLHFSPQLDFNDMGFQQRASLDRAAAAVTRRFRAFDADDPRASVIWRLKPELRWNADGAQLGHVLGLTREAQQRSGSLLTSQLEVVGAGIDDLISRGNGDVRMDARLRTLSQSYQGARLGKWRIFAGGTLLQEGNEDYAFEAEAKVEYFARDDFSVAARTVMLWSRDWLIWLGDDLLASFRRTQALVAGDLNWFPAPNQELRVKLQWLAIDARRPTPYRIAPTGELIESPDAVAPFQVNNFGLQVRYRWTFAPQSDLYVVYGRGGILFEQDPDGSGLGDLLSGADNLRDSDQLIVKMRYRF